MSEVVKRYSNGEVTIVWRPKLCAHSALCFRGLPAVFDPRSRPWVNASGAPTAAIVAQVKACPSGALSLEGPGAAASHAEAEAEVEVEPSKDGPLLVKGTISLKRPDGTSAQHHNITELCRCGHSANKPFCDGSHRKAGFKSE